MAAKTDKIILVIEDDAELCRSIQETLQRSGYRVVTAVNSREAMGRLKLQTYGCILVDMKLGEESGADLVDAIRTRPDLPNSKTPVIVVSGNLDKDLVGQLVGKIQGAIVKPFPAAALIDNVKKYC